MLVTAGVSVGLEVSVGRAVSVGLGVLDAAIWVGTFVAAGVEVLQAESSVTEAIMIVPHRVRTIPALIGNRGCRVDLADQRAIENFSKFLLTIVMILFSIFRNG